MAYTDATTVKAYLEIESENEDDDALIEELIERAQAVIEEETHRKFEAEGTATTRTFGLDRVDGGMLIFDTDICEITEVTNRADAASPETIPASAYVTLPRNETPYYAIRLKVSSDYTWDYEDDPEDAIEVTGYWAYSKTPPPDIVQATVRLVAWLYRQRADNSGDTDRPLLADGVWIMPSRLPADVRDIVDNYKPLAPR